MEFSFPVEEVSEGEARVLVPIVQRVDGEPIDHARSKSAVFYNPIMRLNRDTAVLSLSILCESLGRPTDAREPMCGTGIRGIRFIVEAGARLVVLGDLNPSAIALTEENSKRNGVSEYVRIREMDANLLMNIHSSPMNRFDYIDVDPFGSPSPFLDSAFRAIRDNGVIALTATDTAPLCGVNPQACLRKYGGRPIRASYGHEVALRLLSGSAIRAAALHERSANPVLSYYSDHYVRTYLLVKSGARRVDLALGEIGFIVHCPKCLDRCIVKGLYSRAERTCRVCGGRIEVGGPMWLGDLANEKFLADMIVKAKKGVWDRRLKGLLSLISGELGLPPTFHNVDEVTRRLRQPSVSPDSAIEALTSSGFKAVHTHFDPQGIRTNATAAQVENILKSSLFEL